MKKSFLISLMAVAALVILPLTSMAAMTAVTDSELEAITGQAGIDIAFDIQATIGHVAYTDSDGATGATNSAVLTIQDISIPQISCDFSSPMTIDVANDTTNQWIEIGLPNIQGTITINAIKVGNAAESGASIGTIEIGDLNLAASTLKIKGH